MILSHKNINPEKISMIKLALSKLRMWGDNPTAFLGPHKKKKKNVGRGTCLGYNWLEQY